MRDVFEMEKIIQKMKVLDRKHAISDHCTIVDYKVNKEERGKLLQEMNSRYLKRGNRLSDNK